MEQKDIREEQLRTPEVLYILQRIDTIDEKYDKKIEYLLNELKEEIKSVRDELKETKQELTTLFWRIVAIIVAVQGAAIAILQFLK